MKAHEPQGADARRSDDRRRSSRAPRRTPQGPIGFAQVFQLVRRDQRPGGQLGRASDAVESAAVPNALLLDHAAVQQAAGTPAPALATALGSSAPVDAACARTSGPDAGAQATHLGALSPGEAMDAVAEEARQLDMSSDARELHIELEPAHLGPIVVRLLVERGRIRTELVAREERAARLLASGSDALRERLVALGYTDAQVDVQHEEDLVLGK